MTTITAPPGPSRDAADPRLGRIWLRRELLEAGHTDRSIAMQVRAGVLSRVRQGAYAEGPAWCLLDDVGRHEVRTRAVIRQAHTPVVASHTSGLSLWEAPVWGQNLDDVHVTREDGRAGRREAGVRQHRGLILPGDLARRHDVPVMHPTRLALETTMVAEVEPALVAVNDLLHRGLTTPELLRARYAQGMAHWEGSLATDVVLRLADPRIESVGETRTSFLIWRHGPGIPRPLANYPIMDGQGEIIWRADFAWPQLGAWLEFDGKEKYLRHRRPGESVIDAVLREKRRQERIEEITGWRCIRVIWVDLERPQHTIARIHAVLFPTGH